MKKAAKSGPTKRGKSATTAFVTSAGRGAPPTAKAKKIVAKKTTLFPVRKLKTLRFAAFEDDTVRLARSEYNAMIEMLERLQDEQTLIAAEADAERRDYLPSDSVRRLIAGEHPVRVWREHRGLSQKELAGKADVPPGYLSEIETGKKPGSTHAFRALASALGVAIEDLLP
jgi:DNA-binding XRE family transcriptional regulator